MTQKYSGAQNFVNYTEVNENLRGGAYYSPSYVFNDYNTGYNLEGGVKRTKSQKKRDKEAEAKLTPEQKAIVIADRARQTNRESMARAAARKATEARKIKEEQEQETIELYKNEAEDLLVTYDTYRDPKVKMNQAVSLGIQNSIAQLKKLGVNNSVAKNYADNLEKNFREISLKIQEADQAQFMPEQIYTTREGQASSMDEQEEEQKQIETSMPQPLNIGQADAIQGATIEMDRGGLDPKVGEGERAETNLEGNKPIKELEDKYTERKQEFDILNNEEDTFQNIDEAVINNPQTPAEIDPDTASNFSDTASIFSNDSFLRNLRADTFYDQVNNLMEQGFSQDLAIEMLQLPSLNPSERKMGGIESGLPSQILPQRQGQAQATPSIAEQKSGLEGQGDNMMSQSDLQKLTSKIETGYNFLLDGIIKNNDANKLFTKDKEKQLTDILKQSAQALLKDPNGLLLPMDKQLKFGVENVMSSLNLPKGQEESVKQALTEVVKNTMGYKGEPVPLLKVKERIRLQADPDLIKKRVSSYFGDKYILQRAPTRIVQPTEYLNYIRVGGVRYA